MKRIDLRSVAVGLFIGAVAVLAVGAVSSTRQMEFEYKIVPGRVFGGELEKAMNNVGAWEYVNVQPFADQHAFAVFRRPRQKE